MKRVLILLLPLLLLACSSQPARHADRQKSAELNAELGLRYMLQGNHELAMEKLRRALEFNPDSANAHHYMAELYRRLNRPDEARSHYREALRAAPDQSALRNNYGVFLCDQGRYDEAEEQFLRVLDNPVYRAKDEVYENLGLCLRRKPDHGKAEHYFREALKLNPRRPKSLLGMGEISFEKGRELSGRGYLQRYEEVALHTAESLWLGIQLERRLGDKAAVSRYGRQLTTNFPDSREAARYRATQKE